MSKPDFLEKFNKNNILIGIAVVGVVVAAGLIYADSNPGISLTGILGSSTQQTAQKAVDYINNNNLASTPASLGDVTEVSGLIKMKLKIGENEFDSYITKDGKLLFPQAFDLSEQNNTGTPDDSENGSENTPPTPVTKSDNPMFEAFVVSQCPYGVQMQRAMEDAVRNLPALAPYMKVRYIGAVSGNTITAMHGEEEAKENLRQICVRDEQPAKYWDYVGCYMKAGDTEGCLASTKVDVAKMNSCVSDVKRGVAYASVDFDLANNNNIGGSPTLMLNGAKISESGFGGRSSDGVRAMICAGFNTEAGFCTTKLNTAQAAASFSATYASATGGSTAPAAGCE